MLTRRSRLFSVPLRSGSGKTVIFELALLRFFKDELLNPEYARKLGGIAAAQPLTGPELAAAAAAGGADDDMTNAQVAASAAPAAPAKMSRIGDKKAVYLAPLKSVEQAHKRANDARLDSSTNLFSHSPTLLLLCLPDVVRALCDGEMR